jgi:hypothetical protein
VAAASTSIGPLHPAWCMEVAGGKPAKRLRAGLCKGVGEARPASAPAPASSLGTLCIVCQQGKCICPPRVKYFATYPACSAQPENYLWLRFKVENGVSLLGCAICAENRVGRLAGRQALGRFAQNLHGSVQKDTFDRHVKNATGDHQRAVKAWRDGLRVNDTVPQPAVAASFSAQRSHDRETLVRPSCNEHNIALIAYTCIKHRIMPSQCEAMCNAAYAVGADINNRHRWGAAFYRELTDFTSLLIFEGILEKVMQAQEIAVHVDEADGLLVVRVRFVGTDSIPTTCLWSARRIYKADSEALCDEVIRSFTVPPCEEVPSSAMLLRESFAKKLKILTADGAAVNGVRQGGRPAPAAYRGNNLGWRLHLLADSIKELPDFEVLSSLIRRLACHVAHANYAPRRILNHAELAADVCRNYPDLIMYTYAGRQVWSQTTYVLLQRARSWLLLAALADVLAILRKANILLQREHMMVSTVDDIIGTCGQELDEYLKSAPTIMRLPAEPAVPLNPIYANYALGVLCGKTLRAKHARSTDGTWCLGLHAKLEPPAKPPFTHVMPIVKGTISGVLKSIEDMVILVRGELSRRFTNIGVASTFEVLAPDYTASLTDTDVAAGALKRHLSLWADHFALDHVSLVSEYRDLQVARALLLRDKPELIHKPLDCFWREILQKYQIKLPVMCGCVRSMLCLDQQNAQVERDIGRYEVIREMTCDQIGWERLDARARVVIAGPKADELQLRGGAPNKFLQELVADFHAAKWRVGPRERAGSERAQQNEQRPAAPPGALAMLAAGPPPPPMEVVVSDATVDGSGRRAGYPLDLFPPNWVSGETFAAI